ncbi:hypothetical protein V12B01_13665 [Vibrio splendidus 12B01]|nr:hypothetical protein V12B01_13665 [Vibrio splendidus 12B01]
MPYGGHQQESFTVEGVKFSYSDFSISPGIILSRMAGL